MLKHFLMDRFKHPRQDLSEDEREDDEDDDGEADSESGKGTARSERARKKQSKEETKKDDPKTNGGANKGKNEDSKTCDGEKEKDVIENDIKVEPKDGRRTPLHARDMEPVIFCLENLLQNLCHIFNARRIRFF
jgi:hypothetical protein